jgi:hypothetical protein
LILLLAGCASSPYQLPAPPPQEEQRHVAADPAEQAELERKNYLQARASLLDLYKLLSDGSFDEAESLLSQQTRDFLAYGNQNADAAGALASGTLALPDGRTVEFEPVEFLLGGEVRQIEDTVEGAEEHETPRRRELFVVDADGEPQKVVMILEGGQWVLHRTAINPGEE